MVRLRSPQVVQSVRQAHHKFFQRVLLWLAALVFAVVPLAMGKPALAAEPAQAANLLESLKSKLEGVKDWTAGVWDATKCVTDIDCLITNATVSIGNNMWLSLVGVTFDDLGGDELMAMMRGDWDVGLAYTAAGAIDGFYSDPPGLGELHFASYMKRELSDNILNQRAYAQTAGEAFIGPVEGAWRAIRRFAYGLSLVVMVIIGFMIMFQKQLPARTVLTFTSALPRILVSLVLITFSFSIVALVFDIVGVFGSTVALEALKTEDTGNFLDALVSPVEEITTGGLSGSTLGSAAGVFIGNFMVGFLQPFLDEGGVRGALQALISGTFFLVALVVALIAIAIQMCYRGVKIIVSTVFAPLVFLIGSLPGQEAVSESFILSLVADCAAFPAIAFMFSLSLLFLVNALELGLSATDAITAVAVLRSTAITGMLSLVLLVMAFTAPGKISGVINPVKKRK